MTSSRYVLHEICFLPRVIFFLFFLFSLPFEQIQCGQALPVLLQTTSTRDHSGQNVVASRGAAWI